MRLFLAIEIPHEIRTALASLLHELRDVSPQTKWVRPSNLHLTVRFLGETDASKLSAVQSSMATIRCAQPITLEFRGLGLFPNAKHPRVLWAGICGSADLQSIAVEVDRRFRSLGFPPEGRTFTPHLTLARFNEPGLPATLRAATTAYASRSFGSFLAREFQLIESKLKSSGAEYTTIQTFSFAPEA